MDPADRYPDRSTILRPVKIDNCETPRFLRAGLMTPQGPDGGMTAH